MPLVAALRRGQLWENLERLESESGTRCAKELGARQALRARRALRHRYSPFNVIITHFRLLLRRVLAHLNRIIPHRRIIVRESKSIKWRLVV